MVRTMLKAQVRPFLDQRYLHAQRGEHAEAVAHLKECCPKYETYLSCEYFTDAANISGRPDLTKGESRCLAKMSCGELSQAVPEGSWI